MEQATTLDGRSATVTLSAVWRPPVVAPFFPDGIRIDATATARTVTADASRWVARRGALRNAEHHSRPTSGWMMNERSAVRPPLRDWRWWAAFTVLIAIAFIGGNALFRAGFDSGAAGALASLPLLLFGFFTAFWRQRARSNEQSEADESASPTASASTPPRPPAP